MTSALLWGAVAGAANLLGALIVLFVALPQRLIAYVMALGTGALIGAVSFELLGEALELGSLMEIALGFLGGAALFTVFDVLVNRQGGRHRKRSGHGTEKPENSDAGSGLAIFIGTIMDAIPETAMIGLGIAQGGGVGVALIAAIFISNLPEGISSTTGLKQGGYTTKKVMFMWVFVLAASALSSLLGFSVLEQTSEATQAIISSFAAGAIIAMVASTMMPEAYEKGGPIVGLITAVGIFITLVLG
ncbi:ZIP family metal transporter [Planomicrobium sp. CPCC 101079]|uniref:ZIP family metal transporter n=1 Tax=Planomicrobium sp. CPCC 101079 TaxID=2599618 RepID=UPI0011B3B264|nr:ZIP family metal transporter [Planomicrobium sp. CPCC 101079]TWT09355.1 ZIP family metal transporter [Planomicrobium sp. CPCC 101079]